MRIEWVLGEPEVHQVEHARAEMGERRDGLHLNRVALLQRVVQQSGRVNHLQTCVTLSHVVHRAHLPAQILVVCVSNKERLCRERIRLDLDVRAGDGVDEGRLADVGEARHNQRARVGIDGRQA